MTVQARLDRWRQSGAISAAQHDVIAAVERGDRFSRAHERADVAREIGLPGRRPVDAPWTASQFA